MLGGQESKGHVIKETEDLGYGTFSKVFKCKS